MARRSYASSSSSSAKTDDENVGEATSDEVVGEATPNPLEGLLKELEGVQGAFDKALVSRDMVDVKNADSRLDQAVEKLRGIVNCS